MKYIKFPVFLSLSLLFACGKKGSNADATGIFEAQEVIISAEAAGVLKQFAVEEGQALQAGQQVGAIDCEQLSLQKEQVNASEQALELRKTEAAPQNQVVAQQMELQNAQIAAQREQLRILLVEQQRLQRLVAGKAVPSKQLDDLNGQVAVLGKQIAASQSQMKVLEQQIQAQTQTAAIANRGILSEKQPLGVKKAILDDQIRRCKVVNPVSGTVLSKYAEAFEMTAPGKALYKIANLDTLTLRAYFTGSQLPGLKIGQQVNVLVSQGDAPAKAVRGVITWISDKAEFTPKTIQTVEERANLVYAVKIRLRNDGFLKIGMYAEILL